MEQVCVSCGALFEPYPVVGGIRLDLKGRKHCLDCRPIRHLARPRARVVRAVRLNTCEACGQTFPDRVVIDGTLHNIHNRRFCLSCSPFRAHNTSRVPPGPLSPAELAEYRRRRRNAKTYRYQKRHRAEVKVRIVAARGGRCVDCGYSDCVAALDLHHRDALAKDFAIGSTGQSWESLLAEAEKCDLVCARCHRLRHLAEDAQLETTAVTRFRRAIKARAVIFMGGACQGCGIRGPGAIFDFHHRDAGEKDFGIGQDGIPRSWPKVVAELAKCVMLCANCHREVHAGVRVLDEGLLGLAESHLAYAA